jgi:hypothetical protein
MEQAIVQQQDHQNELVHTQPYVDCIFPVIKNLSFTASNGRQQADA